MRILGPLVCSSTSPVTATFSRSLASVVTFAPSTTRATGSETLEPGSDSSFSTLSTSPTATLYCLPPVLTIAYVAIVPLRLWAGATGGGGGGVLGAGHNGPAVVGVSRKTTGPGYVRRAYRVKSPQVTARGRCAWRHTTAHWRAHLPDSSSTTP